ncbi:MAG TPA: phasin family protein, partial [Burkholderiales bacterium]|nr:phasin family protein [Burkholderiales bacterium]
MLRRNKSRRKPRLTDRRPLMYVSPDQIQSTNKSNVEALLSVASMQFSALEKLATLSSTALKGAFEDALANARALATA